MLRLAWRLRPFIAAGAAVLIVVRGDTSLPVPDVRSLSAPATAPAGGTQHAPGTLITITPIRALDTRGGEPLGADGRRVVLLPDGATASEVGAVVLSVTVLGATEPTYLTVGPEGSVSGARIDAATPSATGLAIAALDGSGAVTLSNAAGHAHVVLDVTGYLVAG